MGLSEKDRKELYDYCCKIGFIVKSAKDWNENKKIRKLKQYMRNGYRVAEYSNEFEVINIFHYELDEKIVKNIEDIYRYLIKT